MAEIIRKERCYKARGFVMRPVIKCHCGREVVCEGFTNTCDCGADYNFAGQLLANRSQWGEETGESLSDILNIQ